MAIEISNIIEDWVPDNSKVIDFGCGDGSLLHKLKKDKNILGYGLEINDKKLNDLNILVGINNEFILNNRIYDNKLSNDYIYNLFY